MARVPIYRVIADDLLAQISSGDLPISSQLPTEAELSTRYGVSRMTVRQAMDQLESAKVIVRLRGSGSYVREAPKRLRGMDGLRSFTAEFGAGGASVASRIVHQETTSAVPREVTDELATARSTQFVRLARVRLVEGVPAAYQESWIPFSVAPGLARDELIDGSLYRTLAERYSVELGWASQIISTSLATKQLAGLLDEKPRSPLLTIRRTTYSKRNVPIEFVRSWTRESFPLIQRIEAD
ncbi:GntR family transcriptional regulator [Asanoa iriomotensis]|uniref:HTH-type transcriptional repressor YvoA n=1 Tax=Asanoa iriomotensis TaxID=234613 RepID=A0ABQ4BYY3_9ACTN|nr:GntR family transcriptional regulator [Asanoa iriomotensis]GIF55742.1 HTH-type transcriptional repressor YvoA [Asanoa iriomotensis]